MRKFLKYPLLCCSVSAFLGNTFSQEKQQHFVGTTSLHGQSKEVEELLEKAARIRQEIAVMEGKTVEEVEQEARDKKKDMIDFENSISEKQEKTTTSSVLDNNNICIPLPNSPAEMIEQAVEAVERAKDDGIRRQTVRFALVREDETNMANVEAWPGGAKQMCRESGKPLTIEMMKKMHDEPYYRQANMTVTDVWDFDGSAIVASQSNNNTALIFANTDIKYTRDIKKLDEELGNENLLLLINPFWRDLSSWGINLLSPGAKKLAKEVIFDDNNFPETYSFLRYDVRGKTCAALKLYPYDWQIYAYLEDEYGFERPIWLGSSGKNEPNGTLVTDLLVKRPEYLQSWKKRFL